MLDYPHFSFWIPISLAKVYFFPIVITFAKIHLYLFYVDASGSDAMDATTLSRPSSIFLLFFPVKRFVEAVKPEVLELFREAAEALVDKLGAVDAVAASLAHISGTKEIKSRSLLSGREV